MALVLAAGLMAGCTIGLMSTDLVANFNFSEKQIAIAICWNGDLDLNFVVFFQHGGMQLNCVF